jgi:hypothetical protein
MKLCVYIMASKSISTAYVINPIYHSMCPHVYPLTVTRQRLSKYVSAATNTRNNITIFRRVVFYTVRVLSKLVCGSVCVAPVLVHAPPKRRSEGSQGLQTVKYGLEPPGARCQGSLCWRGPAGIYWTRLGCVSLYCC